MKFWLTKNPLIQGDTVNLNALSPRLAETLKACLGKLDRTDLEPGDCEHIQKLYDALGGGVCTVVCKGLFTDYGPPIEYIKVLPPNPKRK